MGASTVWMSKSSSPFTLRHSPLFTQRLSLLYLPCRYIFLFPQRKRSLCLFRDKISTIYPVTHLYLAIDKGPFFYPATRTSLFSQRYSFLCLPSDKVFSLSPTQSPLFVHLHCPLHLPTKKIFCICPVTLLLYLPADTISSICPPTRSPPFTHGHNLLHLPAGTNPLFTHQHNLLHLPTDAAEYPRQFQ